MKKNLKKYEDYAKHEKRSKENFQKNSVFFVSTASKHLLKTCQKRVSLMAFAT